MWCIVSPFQGYNNLWRTHNQRLRPSVLPLAMEFRPLGAIHNEHQLRCGVVAE
jgi:hypothetical protein